MENVDDIRLNVRLFQGKQRRRHQAERSPHPYKDRTPHSACVLCSLLDGQEEVLPRRPAGRCPSERLSGRLQTGPRFLLQLVWYQTPSSLAFNRDQCGRLPCIKHQGFRKTPKHIETPNPFMFKRPLPKTGRWTSVRKEDREGCITLVTNSHRLLESGVGGLRVNWGSVIPHGCPQQVSIRQNDGAAGDRLPSGPEPAQVLQV